jgi:predicted transcriptional regulator
MDLLRCMYNLSDLDLEAMRLLLKEGPMKAEDLADRLEKDRSTMYRALQKMVSCQIVEKETRSLERGGYFHVYAVAPRDVLLGRLNHCVEDWYGRMKSLISNFDEDMDNL